MESTVVGWTPAGCLSTLTEVRRGSPPRWLALRDGEVFLRSAGANRATPAVAAGGWLALTSQRLVHHSHGAEKALTGTPDWCIELREVVGTDVAPRSLRPADLLTGRSRRRLRVTTTEASTALFVVNGVDGWRAAVDDARRAVPSGRDPDRAPGPGQGPATSVRASFDVGDAESAEGPGSWRRYWCVVVPLVVSLYVTLLLGILLLARALGLGSGVSAVGGLLVWLVISLWSARPGAGERAARPDWRTAGRRHTAGVVSVDRSPRGAPVGSTAAESAADVTEAAPPQRAAERAEGGAASPGDVAWAACVLAVDVTVVVVLITTGVWGAWVTALSLLLLVTHLWLLLRALRWVHREEVSDP